jgi:hypothetical protein
MGVVGNSGTGGRATHWRLGLVAALLGWGGYFAWIWPRMFFERAGGLVAGWRTLWADWAAHLAYAEVFAQRNPSQWLASHPLHATERFDYPFLADAISGLLMRAGLDRIDAFVWPSLLMSLLLVALLYAFYARRLESAGRALLALTLFFTNGGLGFLLYANDLLRTPGASGLAFPAREYTWLPEHHIEWINLVSSELLPQRGLLLGLPLALGVLVTLLRWRAEGFERTSRAQIGGLGFFASLLLLTHAHSFLALAWICGWLLLFDLRNARSWLGFAVATALPAVFWGWLCYGGVASRGFVTWFPGWLANPVGPHPMPLWRFLWLNWGVFLPLAAVAVGRLRGLRDPLVWAGGSLFLACMLVRFQPNPWDNTKLLTWAHLLLCAPVAAYLASLWHRPRVPTRVLALLLFVCATASGFLELWRIGGGDAVAVRMWSRDEVELADAFREVAPPDALVLCSDHHHHWVPALAGRRVLLGYRGWLTSYGIDYREVERDVRRMLQHGDPTLLERYGVDFVVIGATERESFAARESAFQERWPLALERAGTRVYDVRAAGEGS